MVYSNSVVFLLLIYAYFEILSCIEHTNVHETCNHVLFIKTEYMIWYLFKLIFELHITVK